MNDPVIFNDSKFVVDTEASRRPEIEYEITKNGSCFVGDCICYHPTDPKAFAETQAADICRFMAEQEMPILHFFGMARGYIQAELARRLPPTVRLVLWDEHPNLSKIIVDPDDYDLIHRRWVVVHNSRQFVAEVDYEIDATRKAHGGRLNQPVRRTLAVQPGLNEVMHWALGLTDWMKRNRRGLRSANLRAFVPSPRSFLRISMMGRIPGVHQFNKIGERDAIVVSCGPSLTDDALDAIRLAMQRGAVLFCVGQALKRVNAAGIVPHFVIVADPSEVMYQMIKDGKFGVALCDSMVSEEFPNHAVPPASPLLPCPELWLKGRMAYYNILSSHVHQAACDMVGWPAFDDSFATVSEIAVVISRILGAPRMFLFGMDYAAGPETTRNPFPQYASSFRMPTYDGRLVWTNAHYNHGRRWLEAYMSTDSAKGTVHRYSVGLPAVGEKVLREPKDMLSLITPRAPFQMPKAPAAREMDILAAMVILKECRKKGFDADDATNKEHPEDFRYALMGSSHERKLTLIELAMDRVTGTDASDRKAVPVGAVVPAEE